MNDYAHYVQKMNRIESEDLDIKKGYFIIAIKDDSEFSNALPLFYHNEDTDYGEIDYEEISKILVGNRNDNILNRFCNHEPFVIAGKIETNGTKKSKYEPDCFMFASKAYDIDEIKADFLFEIFRGKVKVSDSTIVLENDKLRELIIESYIPDVRPILILDANQIYGPFKITSAEEFTTYKVAQYSNYTIQKIPYKKDLIIHPLIEYTNNIERLFIIDNKLKEIRQEGYDIDFISDDALLKWAQDEYRQSSLPPEVNEEALDVLKKWVNNSSIDKTTDRYKRLCLILEQSEKYKNALNSFLEILPKVKEVKSEISKLETIRLELENDRNQLDSEKKKLELKKSNLEQELKEKEAKLEEIYSQTEKARKDIEEDVESKIQDKKKQLEELDAKIAEERRIKEDILIKDEKDKKELLAKIQTDIEYFGRQKKDLEQGVEKLKSDFVIEQNKAYQTLVDLVKSKTHFEIIRGRRFGEQGEDIYENKYCPIEIKREPFSSYTELRTKIIEILNKQDRNYDQHFIDNILISIHQNLLTVFAGYPGSGKTSLARILCNALGTKKRAFEIPVGRGWTSQKELLGFHNPLSGKFIESHKGLYSMLKNLDHEWENEEFYNNPFLYIILDEANLSPIEHYWSSFINDTDNFAVRNKPLVIDLGQEGKIEHANAIRFIGTINNDHTTEQLSPRILDRINLVNIRPKENSIIGRDLISEDIEELGLLFNECKTFFQLRDMSTPEFEKNDRYEAQMDKYKEIKEIFANELKIQISPRIDIAVDRYCRVATKYMLEKFRPIDYCIAQRILPLINIYGDDSTIKTIEKLLEKFKEFSLPNSISVEILSNIKEIGTRNGYTKDNFNYFLTLSNY